MLSRIDQCQYDDSAMSETGGTKYDNNTINSKTTTTVTQSTDLLDA